MWKYKLFWLTTHLINITVFGEFTYHWQKPLGKHETFFVQELSVKVLQFSHKHIIQTHRFIFSMRGVSKNIFVAEK